MKNLIKSFTLLLLGVFTASYLHAQPEVAPEGNNKQENIIIRKKGTGKEKVTIVIDGDKMTVNGKPVDDFKSDDVEIVRSGDMGGFAFAMPPMPPGRESFNKDFMREMRGNKAFLGVMTDKTDKGAKITDVTDESPADKAGLKEEDIITKVGTDAVTGPDDLYKAIGKYKPKDKVTITYSRNGKEGTVSAELEESKQMRVFSYNGKDGDFNKEFNFKMPAMPDFEHFDLWMKKPRLGLQVQDTEDSKGIKVLDADDDSPAAKAGIKENDVITQVNGKAINSVDDLKESIKDVKDGDTVKVTFTRNGQTQNVDVKFPKDLKTIDL